MRFVIVGLGSMGKRRIRNLHVLEEKEIIGFDVKKERRIEAEQKYGIKTVSSFDECLSAKPDAILISTPPDLHIHYALQAACKNIDFFMEASVVLDGMDELITECRGRNIVAAPSATMRFHPSIQMMKRLIDQEAIGKVLAFNYHCGQYLPDWHPYEDYRQYYVSKRETGGCREIVPFELAWITWLLGPVQTISCNKAKLSKLDADIDDIYQMLLKFQNGTMGMMQIDVISRIRYRVLKMISDEGVITWDWDKKVVNLYNVPTGWQDYAEASDKDKEQMYVREMRHFIGALHRSHPYMYTLEDDKRILELLGKTEKVSDGGALK